MKYYFSITPHVHCPVLGFVLSADTDFLYSVDFVLNKQNVHLAPCDPTMVHLSTQKQIELYLAGQLKVFDLPVKPCGTVFQQRVWTEIAAINFGQTVTYGDIAIRLGGVHLARAVGQAANKNPIPVIIPCHRVVGKGGQMTGFASGIVTKRFLLDLERGKSF